MKKKQVEKESSNKKKLATIENKIKFSETNGFEGIDLHSHYYLIYFTDLNTIAIFKADLSKKKKIELPYMLLNIKNMTNINFRIPQKLNDLMISFDQEKSLSMRFQDESVKNELGDKIKKLIKQPEKLKDGIETKYTVVELKYKLAKLLESEYFENFKENYDYRKFLDFDYLLKFNQIYNNKSDVYKYLYNRFFMGKIAFLRKKSNIIRKGS